ncbi:hypothetical protein J7E88_29670 [Streptomyces sp. ISL-10]|uniref:hypothetical protein n=1 Tax=Streptomyces sp. ISL-10 TaxID=2819172 RepID=UPI001BE57569|nr:hypothetical protein [Streptomyces sp. ISL-10]MBT2369356.1 hypothetical protein [Streptomyces sp. ISL-10]
MSAGRGRGPCRIPRCRAPGRERGYPEPTETYHATLERSPYSAVEMVPFDQAVVRSVEELIALQLSNSSSTPAQLGPRRAAFAEDLRRALLAYDSSSRDEETISTEALIAARPLGHAGQAWLGYRPGPHPYAVVRRGPPPQP